MDIVFRQLSLSGLETDVHRLSKHQMRTAECETFACQLAVEEYRAKRVREQVAYEWPKEPRVTGALELTK